MFLTTLAQSFPEPSVLCGQENQRLWGRECSYYKYFKFLYTYIQDCRQLKNKSCGTVTRMTNLQKNKQKQIANNKSNKDLSAIKMSNFVNIINTFCENRNKMTVHGADLKQLYSQSTLTL